MNAEARGQRARDIAWRKSSYSASNSNCVEVGLAGMTPVVRDSKDPDGPVLAFSAGEWAAFVNAVRSGEFPHQAV